MKYTPVSEKEYNERMLLPAGEYAFEVLNAEPSVSKTSGADMIVLDLLIHASDGSNRKVRSYLVGSEGGRFQVRAFCKSAGLVSKYEAGTFCAEDCLGRSGWLKLKVEAGRLKDDGTPWPDKNSVASFIDGPSKKVSHDPGAFVPAPAPAPKPAPAAASATTEDADSEIPF